MRLTKLSIFPCTKKTYRFQVAKEEQAASSQAPSTDFVQRALASMSSLNHQMPLHPDAARSSASVETEWLNSAMPTIAVLLPCYNEEVAVAKCVKDFRQALPQARVLVFDNNSKDKTAEVATAAGAEVRKEARQGKGNVVRRMFADIEADIYVMADGDATYDASAAPEMIQLLLRDNLDMVVGCRTTDAQDAYRPGHRFGNAVLTGTLAWMFGRQFTDILSGYRVFSRRFVKSFPALSGGFEIETEITVHALELRAPVGELVTRYGARPSGSVSKLSTYRDGIRILLTMVSLFRQERPALFYGVIAAALSASAIALSIPLLITYAETGLVPRLPTAVLTTGLMLLAALSAVCGLILDTVTRGRREARRLAYLSLPSARR